MPTLVLVGTVTAIVSSLGAPLIPTIARSSHVSLSTGQWLLTAALLTGALATPVMGRLADGARQRDVILVSLGVVFAGCVLAAVSDQFIVMVAGRALQGIGLGLLPVTMAIARRNLPLERAGRAIATLSITVAVGAGIGYPVTGLIAEFVDFHAAFWFGAVMVAGAIALASVVLPGRSVVAPRPFDTVGAVTLVGGHRGHLPRAERGRWLGVDVGPHPGHRGRSAQWSWPSGSATSSARTIPWSTSARCATGRCSPPTSRAS